MYHGDFLECLQYWGLITLGRSLRGQQQYVWCFAQMASTLGRKELYLFIYLFMFGSTNPKAIIKSFSYCTCFKTVIANLSIEDYHTLAVLVNVQTPECNACHLNNDSLPPYSLCKNSILQRICLSCKMGFDQTKLSFEPLPTLAVCLFGMLTLCPLTKFLS